jgi:hypothetical protein
VNGSFDACHERPAPRGCQSDHNHAPPLRGGILLSGLAAGLLKLAGHVDLDELDRWMRIGWERRRGADIQYGQGFRNLTRGLDLVLGFRFDLDRTHRRNITTRTGAMAATPHNSCRHALSCCGGGDCQDHRRECDGMAHDTRREDYEQQPQSVRAVRGRSPRRRGVRAVGPAGGAQLDVLGAHLGEPRGADFRNVLTYRLFSAWPSGTGVARVASREPPTDPWGPPRSALAPA